MLLMAAQVCLQLFLGRVADGYNAYRPLMMTRSRALASTSLGMGAGDVNDSPDFSRGKKHIAVASSVDKFTQQSPSISSTLTSKRRTKRRRMEFSLHCLKSDSSYEDREKGIDADSEVLSEEVQAALDMAMGEVAAVVVQNI